MSLATNPLAEFGFGQTETTQNWTTVINYIKRRCGVIGQFEFSDEALIKEIKEQIIPSYSIYDGFLQYDVLTTADIISHHPTVVYNLTRTKQIISIAEVHRNEYEFISNIGDDGLRGLGGSSIEDFLIARNYADANKSVMATDKWKFIAPARLEMIGVSGLSDIKDIIIAYNTVHPDPSSVNPTMFDKFKDLCAGYFMLIIGSMREKVGNFSTPTGNVELTGQQLKQEGQELLREVKEKLIITPPDQLIHLW